MPEQIRAQQSLITVVHAACREADLPEEIVQTSGDGVLIMPPSDIDETAVLPNLVRGLSTALRQENRLLAEPARIRLRLALTNGVVSTGPTGFSGPAVIECFRLLDSPPVKEALVDHPAAELAVIVSDHLYNDVVRHGFRDMRPEDFWNVRSSMPERNFSANAWLWVSDRTGGASRRLSGTAERKRVEAARPPEEVAQARALANEGKHREALRTLETMTPSGDADRLALLDVMADCLIALGAYQEAANVLDEMLRIQHDPVPSTLLRLGRVHLRLGSVKIARHTFTYLVGSVPLAPEGYLELGRLERLAGNPEAARRHLAEAARLLKADGLVGTLVEELLELSTPSA